MMSIEGIEINFYLAKCSVKEAKRKYCKDSTFYMIDIAKIIKDLGYEIEDLSPESEFVINYQIQKKITQGIYSTRSDDILITYKEISNTFVKNLKDFLSSFDDDKEEYTFKVRWAEELE